MQNSNEHRILITASNQYSNSHSANSNNNETKQMECDIPHMVIPENKERQELSVRCGVDNISNFQNSTTDATKIITNSNQSNTKSYEEDNGYTYSYMVDKLKRNPEDMIDQITFSEDEPEANIPIAKGIKEKNMTGDFRHSELKNICDLYEEDASMTKYTGTKNEMDDRKEIPVPFEITPSDILLEVGIIDDIIDDKIMIKANTMIGTLDLDNIIFTINKIPFGYIDDVIGKIDEAVYVVKYFPNINILSLNLKQGQSTFNVKDKSKYVEQRQLLKKGCDASNAFDEEVSENEMEFSDDEEEMARRAEIRKRKKSTNSNKGDVYKKRKTEEDNSADNCSLNYSMNKLKEKYAFNERGGNNYNVNPMQNSNINTFNPLGYDNKYNYQATMNTNMNVQNTNNSNNFNQFYSYEYKMPGINQINPMNQMNPSQYSMNNNGYSGNVYPNVNNFNPYSQMNPMNMYSQSLNQSNQLHNNQHTSQPNSNNGLNLNLNFQSVNPFQPPNTK